MQKHNHTWFKIGLSSLGLTFAIIAGTTFAGTRAVFSNPDAQAGAIRLAQAPTDSKAMMAEGGPLARQLQGKPVVVDIYATWCPGCKNIAPTLSRLKQDYGNKVNFVVLDVTDASKLRASEAKAKELGLAKFLKENKSNTSMVAIIDPATGKILASYRNNPNTADYTKVLNMALAGR